MDQLAQAGVVGPEEGTKPRKVLMTKEEFENYLQKGNQEVENEDRYSDRTGSKNGTHQGCGGTGRNLRRTSWSFYGKYKAKLSDELWEKIKDREDGKLVLVTAINPTPAGEGKTTTSVGLGQAMAKLNKNAIIALREPSLGPCFGIKGGAAGGGYSQVVPMEDLNLHFTGDFHAITSANNLLAAMLDNHIQQGNELQIDPRQVVWKRCLDMNDRVLRNIVVGLGNKMDGMVREDHFVITVASEIMAILCLADDLADLRARLGRIIVAYNFAGRAGDSR